MLRRWWRRGGSGTGGEAGGRSTGVRADRKEPVTTNTPPGTERFFDPSYNVVRGRVPSPTTRGSPTGRTGSCSTRAPPDRATRTWARPRPAWTRRSPPERRPEFVDPWLREEGVEVDWTEDVTRLPEPASVQGRDLRAAPAATRCSRTARDRSRAAINTTTGAHLDAAKTALRQYIRAGGGFVGIHNAFGTEYNWPWYEGLLRQRQLLRSRRQPGRHGQHRRQSDSIDRRPAEAVAVPDEWYNLEPFPTRVKFLAAVDEDTLATRVDDSSGPRRLPSDCLVPVLRRRPRVDHRARS